MVKLILYLILRISAALIMIILILFCAGDSHPEHHKTFFEGWERPITPSVTEAADETDPYPETEEMTAELLTEYTSEIETPTSETQPSGSGETETDETEQGPVVTFGEAEPLSNNDEYLIEVTVSNFPRDRTFAMLLILQTGEDSSIYGALETEMPKGLYFSSYLYADRAAVLIDGMITEEEIAVSFCIHVRSSEIDQPKIQIIYLEYAERV